MTTTIKVAPDGAVTISVCEPEDSRVRAGFTKRSLRDAMQKNIAEVERLRDLAEHAEGVAPTPPPEPDSPVDAAIAASERAVSAWTASIVPGGVEYENHPKRVETAHDLAGRPLTSEAEAAIAAADRVGVELTEWQRGATLSKRVETATGGGPKDPAAFADSARRLREATGVDIRNVRPASGGPHVDLSGSVPIWEAEPVMDAARLAWEMLREAAEKSGVQTEDRVSFVEVSVIAECGTLEDALRLRYVLHGEGRRIPGPSVKLARVIREAWGFMGTAVEVVNQDSERCKMRATAVDFLGTVSHSHEVDFPLWTTLAGKILSRDEHALHKLLNFKRGVALRQAILEILPDSLVCTCMDTVGHALDSHAEAALSGLRRDDTIQAIVLRADHVGVDVNALQAWALIGTWDELEPEAYADLCGVLLSVEDGFTDPRDAFPLVDVDVKTADDSEAVAALQDLAATALDQGEDPDADPLHCDAPPVVVVATVDEGPPRTVTVETVEAPPSTPDAEPQAEQVAPSDGRPATREAAASLGVVALRKLARQLGYKKLGSARKAVVLDALYPPETDPAELEPIEGDPTASDPEPLIAVRDGPSLEPWPCAWCALQYTGEPGGVVEAGGVVHQLCDTCNRARVACRDHANAKTLWADYAAAPDDKLVTWIEDCGSISADDRAEMCSGYGVTGFERLGHETLVALVMLAEHGPKGWADLLP